ncbi:PQQ-binding-like beta-propeller repeat protein [Streptomyces sp. NPDC059009]|uniref:protein kinase domain-containing protein n=1 Tax=Streptomyces sp. NPDC059009 TaxID=3346694 RepID=UPI0036D00582
MPDTVQDPSPLQPLHPGDPDSIGGFTLLGRLGEGGMGAVYLARSERGRVVALKAVRAHLAREPEFRVRFRLEAEAARTIGGRHGATVVAADTQGTVPWLATEYVLGPSLAEAVERYGPLPEPAVRALGARLARALADIHGSGLVHRDLKPSNVLITATGPRVIDFGIARALGAGRLTRTGQVLGTPAFMSPEQAMGRAHEPPGDVFALAAVLVFAAAGHGPFGGAGNAEILHRVRHAEPELTGVPDALLPALSRCLAKEPDARPPAGSLTGELGGQLGGADGDFAALLPGPLLADLGRRVAGMWELRPSRRPGGEPTTGAPPDGGPARRRLLLAGAGGVLALGAAGAVWAASESGNGRSGGARSGPSPRASGLAPEPLWSYDAKAEATLAGIRGGVLVVQVGDENDKRSVVGLDARTGKVVWKQPKYVTFEETGNGHLVRDPKIVGIEEPLFRLDAGTGELSRFPGQLRSPRLDDIGVVAATSDTVYLQGRSGRLSAVAAYATDSGERLWLHRTGDSDELGTGAVAGGLLLLTTPRDVVAVGRDDGRGRWRVRAATKDAPVLEAVYPEAVADGRVHIGGSEVRTLDLATGTIRWRFGADRLPYPDGQPHYGPPAVRGDTVYTVGLAVRSDRNPRANGHDLLALRASDGKLLWTYHVDGALTQDSPPRFDGGRLYLSTGTVPQPLLAVGLKARRPPWTYRSGLEDDGRMAVGEGWSRSAVRIADDRLHLSVGTRVLTLPL